MALAGTKKSQWSEAVVESLVADVILTVLPSQCLAVESHPVGMGVLLDVGDHIPRAVASTHTSYGE